MTTSRSLSKLALFACAAALLTSTRAEAKLAVTATLPSLAALAAEIGGDDVEATSLAASSQNPHFVDPKPSLVLKLNQSKLLIVNGLELEQAWLQPLVLSARNVDVQPGGAGYLDVSTFVQRIDAGVKVDRSMGDVHPGGNPHFLFDPRASASIATAIGEKLALVDAPHAAAYRDRAKKVAASLTQFGVAQTARFAKLTAEQRRVVTYHESFPYLLDWLGLQKVETLEPKPGVPPDPGHVAQVLATMRSTNARVIVQEEYYPTSTSKTLAGLVQARLVVVPGGARPTEGETLQAHLTKVADALYAACGGTP